MNTDGLLFEVRVLHSRVLDQQRESNAGAKGATI
jgi:hypothetical protein